ncbi:MAG: hypothetical protein R2809_03495 [Flavobacteriales bacterium]
MMITRENYEAYFLDYLEGNLDESLLPQFHRFLDENPDLKVELEMVSDFQLPAPTLTFNRKLMLYKGSEFLYWNLLPGYGLRKYVKPDASAWKGLSSAGVLPKLTAPHIVFENKAALKQPVAAGKVVPLRRAFYYSAAAAAIAALLWTNLSNDPTIPAHSGYSYDGTSTKVPVNNSTKELSTPSDDQLIHTADNKKTFVAPTPIVPEQESYANTPQNEDPSESVTPIVIEIPEENYAQENNVPLPNEITPNPAELQSPRVVDVAYANNTTTSKAYSSIWDLAEDKAKAKLWGNDNYPSEKFGAALASRELKQISLSNNEKRFVIKKVEENGSEYLMIKLGRFKHVRKI